jgi:hypothetical protein
MEKGIALAQSWPANIAGCVVAPDFADMNLLRYMLLRKIFLAKRLATKSATATLLGYFVEPYPVV